MESDSAASPEAMRTGVTRTWTRSPGVIIGLALLAAILVATTVWLMRAHNDEVAVRARDDAIVAAARETMLNLLTIDQADPTGSIARTLRGSTGEFKQQLIGGSDQFTKAVRDAGVSSAGSVADAGIRSVDGIHATVLISAINRVKNNAVPQGESRHYRAVVDLRVEGGVWLVSKLDFVP